ncbi:DUF2339 domain-containing protein [Salinivibrio proteolyticus]|uniref:DUF2339 domain-containing protein n=1 Tax=Salinivibrio proteolyticus TaxID=334715 RepID=UPI0012FFD17B|nr:DUF2339 domain-containing protein [Salinivibrio proteolyticus]
MRLITTGLVNVDMDFLLLFLFAAGMIVLVGSVCGLVALIQTSSLRRELDATRQALKQLQDLRTQQPDSNQATVSTPDTADADLTTGNDGEAHSIAIGAQNKEPLQKPTEVNSVLNHETDIHTDKGYRLVWLERAKQQWLVWSGAGTLALGGLFLVSYLISEGYFPPLARLFLGALFGIGLILSSEWLHDFLRRHTNIDWPTYVPAAIASGGFVSLFGLTLMASNLYGFLPDTLAVGMLAIISLAATFYGLRFGPLLTVVGLIGAYSTPLFSSSAEPHYLLLTCYFLLVAAATTYVALQTRQQWLWSSLWGVHLLWLLAFAHFGAPSHIFAGFLVGSVYLLVGVPRLGWILRPTRHPALNFNALWDLRPNRAQWPDTPLILAASAIAWVAMLATPLLAGLPIAIVLVMLLLIGPILTARWDAWPVLALLWTPLWLVTQTSGFVLDELAQHIALGMGLIMLAYGLLMGKRYPTRILFIWLACIALPLMVSFNALLTNRVWQSDIAYSSSLWLWATCLLGAGALLAVFTRHFGRADNHLAQLSTIRVSLWCGVNAHLTLALTLLLSSHALTLALALQAVAMLWLTQRYHINLASWVIKLLVSIVLVRASMLLVITSHINSLPSTIWLYPVLIGILYIALRIAANRHLEPWLAGALLHLGAIWLTSCTLWLSNTDHLLGMGASFQSMVLMSVNWALLGCVYLYRSHIAGDLAPLYRAGACILLGLTTLTQLWLLIALNPFLHLISVGESIFSSWLWLCWGVPTIVCLYLIKQGTGLLSISAQVWRHGLAAIATFTALLLINGLIRQVWQGDIIVLSRPTADGELYSYSLVWLILASLSVIGGYWRESMVAQQAAMGLLGIVVLKVFLIDMASLEGLMRAMSFIGLGLCLVALGGLFQWLKQRQWAA